MIIFDDIREYYRHHELAEMSANDCKVAVNVVNFIRSGFTHRLKIRGMNAKAIGTNCRTLGRCMPEAWYKSWGDHMAIELPIELQAGVAF